jgi:hypothetical protein
MTRSELMALQRGMNWFVKKYALGYGPLRVDGRMGGATKARIRTIKFLLGYLGKINSIPDHDFRSRLYHPKSIRYSTPRRIARGMRRRSAQRAHWRKNHQDANKKHGVGTYDGIPCANAAIPILQWCRNHGWHGRLVSGYRTPEYSEHLCYQMCGRPQCPGMCAGRATNHAYAEPNRFACDVSDYWNFANVVARCPLNPHIYNRLSRDRVHFSPSGN